MSSEYASKSRCPVCMATDITVFIEISQVPIHCNLLWPTRDEAIHAPTGDIRIGFCGNCCHIFNLAFDPYFMKYFKDYENCLHFSPSFQSYATSLAARLIKQYDLHNKEIIELGCGNGDFLALLCKLGENRGVGFDPSLVHKQTLNASAENITFIKDFYSERYSNYKADFICCRHVLEHIQSPRDFLINLNNAIGTRLNTVIFFEVPNVLFILRDLSIFDIIYEHCSYFSSQSLFRVFTSCGFTVINVTESFEGQFLCIEAISEERLENFPIESQDGLDKIKRYVIEFATNYQSKVNEWKHKLEQIKYSGKRTVVWGAGSKGVTFLNTLRVQDQIEYVVDMNPRKQGMYIAGTGQRIVLPEFLRDYQPDNIIVMNPIYNFEIKNLIEKISVKADIATV